MSAADVNIHVLDAAYKPFPTFEEWSSKTSVDDARWSRYNSALKSADQTRDVLDRALQIAKRAAAIETGAIEGLYEVDRGFTYTVAVEALAWEAALAQKGEKVRSLFESQLNAYDYVLDLATKAEPISEAAIRVLHEVVSSAQETYRVMTAIGPQEQPLPKGQYKTLPNHVRTRKGTDHSYAPVDVTPAEMFRLVEQMRTQAFSSAHPVLQAAYAHYGLLVIHPFADGNGRVARALASTFTYRAVSMPIVILSEHKNSYIDALEAADAGNYQVFVDFMLARSLDTVKLVDDSIRAASVPTAEDSLQAIDRLYVTKGGYTFDEVDKAGKALLTALHSEIEKALSTNVKGKVKAQTNVHAGGYQVTNPAYRLPMGGGQNLLINMSTIPPAAVTISRGFGLLIPKDAGREDDILVSGVPGDDLSARIEEITPGISGVLQMRIAMLAERVVLSMLAELSGMVQQKFHKAF